MGLRELKNMIINQRYFNTFIGTNIGINKPGKLAQNGIHDLAIKAYKIGFNTLNISTNTLINELLLVQVPE